jgi:hypothetical protein
MKADGAVIDPLSTAMDRFLRPNRQVGVSVWRVALAPKTTVGTWAEIETWAADFCAKTKNTPCAGIHDRAVRMCNERRDCHPALLVSFEREVQAFVSDGGPDGMIVLAVWRAESDSTVAEYGGSTRLLEGFLSTMGVVLPTGPDNHP